MPVPTLQAAGAVCAVCAESGFAKARPPGNPPH